MIFFYWIFLITSYLSLQEAVNPFFESVEIPREFLQDSFRKKDFCCSFPDADYRVADLFIPERRLIEEVVNITLPLFTEFVQLQLQPTSLLKHKNFAFLVRSDNTTKFIDDGRLETNQCFYISHQNDIKASVDICDGLNGIILVGTVAYIVRPMPLKYQKGKGNPMSHMIIKLHSSEEGSEVKEKQKKTRKKRSFGPDKEVKIETAVFVDSDLYRHMLNNFPENTERNLFRFVLAMINAVQLLYHDASLEFKVSFVLKRLEILHTEPPELVRSHDIDRYLSSFCTWQEKENIPREKSPLHWDHALMLTGLDLYVIAKSGKFSNQVLGLAPVAGMCKPSSSCTVNEGLHFESVYVVAHEIGHNLGMRHDGPSADNNCDANSHIMSPTLGSGKSTWSTCSNRYLHKFLQSPQAQCLFDTSYVELDHTEGGTLPGERFDANVQCMLKYGKQSERSPNQSIEEICRDLHCTKERYTWTSHPALEGTACGPNKWCRFGRCIDRSEIELTGRIIDGGWSGWTSFSECASGCLHGNIHTQIGSTGISLASRSCNNPRPENGGRQCAGNDKKYETCEAVQCSNIPPITIIEFAEQICRRAREVDKDLTGLGFQRHSSDAEEACTVWCYQYNGGAKSRGWIFPDGTTCHMRRSTPNPMFCVSGRCEEFHCPPTNDTEFIATGEHCKRRFFLSEAKTLESRRNHPEPIDNIWNQIKRSEGGWNRAKFTEGIRNQVKISENIREQMKPSEGAWNQVKLSENGWIPIGPCRYNCMVHSMGLRVFKRGMDHTIQLCNPDCSSRRSIYEYASNLCLKYRERVTKLSGFGIQLSPSLEDPDRPCHVACQDEKFSHRFYLVTGEDGWFPFGVDCTRGVSGRKAYCISGRCLEFGKNNFPRLEDQFTFSVRRRRSLDVENKTVIAMVDFFANHKVTEVLKEGTDNSSKSTFSIDLNNPIHLKPNWERENEIFSYHMISS